MGELLMLAAIAVGMGTGLGWWFGVGGGGLSGRWAGLATMLLSLEVILLWPGIQGSGVGGIHLAGVLGRLAGGWAMLLWVIEVKRDRVGGAMGTWRIGQRRGWPAAAGLLLAVGWVGSWLLGGGGTWIGREAGWRFAGLATFLVAVWLAVSTERWVAAVRGIDRWRIKYLGLAIAVVASAHLFASSQELLPEVGKRPEGWLGRIYAVSLAMACALTWVAWRRGGVRPGAMHASAGAIRGSIVLLLIGVYLVLVGGLARVVDRVGGVAAFELKAVLILMALMVAAVAALSERVRDGLRRWVSRYFRRPLYDVRAVWGRTAEALVPGADRAEIGRRVVDHVAETFRALTVTLWVCEETADQACRVATTAGRVDGEGEMPSWMRPLGPALRVIREQGRCFRLVGGDAGIRGLVAVSPGRFSGGGDRVCVPLVARGGVVGFLIVGDRVNGVTWTEEELELLTTMGMQVGLTLLNLELVEQLARSREAAAFETMAAFLVHDLKNAVTSLSLMASSLPQRHADAAFREDAVRTITGSVGRIHELIERMNRLRHGVRQRWAPVSPSRLVDGVVEGLRAGYAGGLLVEVCEVPDVMADEEQLRTVLVNLVVNAMESRGGRATIRVRCLEEGGWVGVEVSDDGVGMSREFMEERLFRPFQTTKRKGMGIGLYQSRGIVEAHGGRMEVSSVPGKGSTFRVWLPTVPIRGVVGSVGGDGCVRGGINGREDAYGNAGCAAVAVVGG